MASGGLDSEITQIVEWALGKKKFQAVLSLNLNQGGFFSNGEKQLFALNPEQNLKFIHQNS